MNVGKGVLNDLCFESLYLKEVSFYYEDKFENIAAFILSTVTILKKLDIYLFRIECVHKFKKFIEKIKPMCKDIYLTFHFIKLMNTESSVFEMLLHNRMFIIL